MSKQTTDSNQDWEGPELKNYLPHTQEPPHKETASKPIIAESNDELDEILYSLQPEEGYAGKQTERNRAKSAINSLTLKQILAMIGEDDLKTDVDPYRKYVRDIRNAFRAELRQSARKRYQ